MKTEADIRQVVADLNKTKTRLLNHLEVHAKHQAILTPAKDEMEQRDRAVKAIKKNLETIRVQLHSFNWVLSGN
jgi:hypothetical protein